MTQGALDLLRLCAARTLIMQHNDPRWEVAQELLNAAFVGVAWVMKGGWLGLAATDRGLSEVAALEDWS